MNNNGRGGRSGIWPLVIGGFIVILGVIFLIQQFTDFEIDGGLIWPFAPIITGIVFLVTSWRSSWLWASIMIIVGLGALLRNSGLFGDFEIGQLWPLAVIAVGVSFLVNWFTSRKREGETGHVAASNGVATDAAGQGDTGNAYRPYGDLPPTNGGATNGGPGNGMQHDPRM